MDGTIRSLFDKKRPVRSPNNRAFRILALLYAWRHLSVENGSKPFFPEEDDLQPPDQTVGEQNQDYIAQLLQCCHRMLLTDEWIPLKPYPIRNVPKKSEIKIYKDSVLQKSSPSALNDLDRLNETFDTEDLSDIITREEKWNQLALIQLELFNGSEHDDFLNALVSNVSEGMRRRKMRRLGSLPPWGYRCLDHSLQIELAIANITLRKPYQDFSGSLIYDDCSKFMRSDRSFLKSWDSTEPDWASNQWNLDCSSHFSSSLLSIATKKPISTPSIHFTPSYRSPCQ
jgi:hypothetical protein